MEPSILYEDDDIIAVSKPSGLAVHADGRSDEPTLVDWLVAKYPGLAEVGEEQRLADGTVIARPGIVHRLDKETSGALVIARTQKAFGSLKKQFQEREVKKTYRAFVYGNLNDERGIIDAPIGSARGGLGPRSAKKPYGTLREARTAYRRIENGEGAAYVEAFPETGRTHQIRVHFASIQHPVLCDKAYAAGRPPLLGFSRLALHAFSLAFRHPGTGKEMRIEAPLPPDFIAAEAKLRRA